MRIEAEGPFRTNKGKLPSADIELRVGLDGGGQTIRRGLLTTGDRAFVKFQDVYYEQPAAQVRRAEPRIAQRASGGQLARALGLDPRSWLAEAKDEGDDDVGRRRDPPRVGHARRRAADGQHQQVRAALGVGARRARPGRPSPRLSEADIRALAEVGQGPELRRLRRQEGRHDPARLGAHRVRGPRGRPRRPRRPRAAARSTSRSSCATSTATRRSRRRPTRGRCRS